MLHKQPVPHGVSMLCSFPLLTWWMGQDVAFDLSTMCIIVLLTWHQQDVITWMVMLCFYYLISRHTKQLVIHDTVLLCPTFCSNEARYRGYRVSWPWCTWLRCSHYTTNTTRNSWHELWTFLWFSHMTHPTARNTWHKQAVDYSFPHEAPNRL